MTFIQKTMPKTATAATIRTARTTIPGEVKPPGGGSGVGVGAGVGFGDGVGEIVGVGVGEVVGVGVGVNQVE